jgi:hypothetical protein
LTVQGFRGWRTALKSDDDCLSEAWPGSLVSDIHKLLDNLKRAGSQNNIFFKSQPQKSNMEANGLEKLLPKSIVAKRRRKKQGSIAETTSSNDEAGPAGAPDGHGGASSASSTPRGRSVISREQTADSTNNSERSNNSMAADEGEDTSLISYDSDPEL